MEIIIAGIVWGGSAIVGYFMYRNLKVAMDAKKYHEENYGDQ